MKVAYSPGQPVVPDRGREGSRLPSLRTVRAVFPHTALQSVVSQSGRIGERFPVVNPSFRVTTLIRIESVVQAFRGLYLPLPGQLTRGLSGFLGRSSPPSIHLPTLLLYERFCYSPVTILSIEI